MKNPSWWNKEHDSAWDRVKAAMKRDWEQTKSDLSAHKAGKDLDQGAGDTVRQAAGKEEIPAANSPTPSKQDRSWDDVEPTYRYAAGAHEQYGKVHPSWNDDLETKLSGEWKQIEPNRPWDEVKSAARHVWDSTKR
jgi:hypothetical protein